MPGLSASGGAGLRPPSRDRFIGEPDREAAALTQAGVIGGPVRDLALLPGNVASAGLVQLEGHGWRPMSEGGRSPTPPSLSAPTSQPIRATQPPVGHGGDGFAVVAMTTRYGLIDTREPA